MIKKNKPMTQEMIDLIDKIMEVGAYIEFLQEALAKHLSSETRDSYNKKLKTAINRQHKLQNKFDKLLEEV